MSPYWSACRTRLLNSVEDMTPTVIDPLAPAPRGMWFGHGVRVTRRTGPHTSHPSGSSVCSGRFCVNRQGELLSVTHDLTSAELSDEIALLLAELAETGLLHGQRDFELVFTGVVRSTVDGGMPAFLRFYRNSLARLECGDAEFAPIHERAADLVVGCSLIDLGSCFGFFPLRVVERGISVLATDLSASTMRLLDAISKRLHRPLRTMSCDATMVPLPDGHADTVTTLHLLEHLTPEAADAVVAEALRLARHRVVIAVPFEDEPRTCYGHIQRFDLPALQGLAERITYAHPDVDVKVDDYHGGWLIADRLR
jgi:hypothetical protein